MTSQRPAELAPLNGPHNDVHIKPSYTYTFLPSLFVQSSPQTSPFDFSYSTENFGLVPSLTWADLSRQLTDLNLTSPPNESYKLLFLARHGEGVHNLAEAFYKREAWDAEYSKHDGNKELGNWVDAELTAKGVEQGELGGRCLRGIFSGEEEKEGDKMMLPQRWYVSPLSRCLHTARLEWSWLWQKEEQEGKEVTKAVVREGLREIFGVHTCDKRSSITEVRAKYPEFELEAGITDQDELWDEEHRETFDEIDVRVRAFFDTLWDEGKDIQIVSLTAHSGWIASVLRVLKHREFKVQTGGILPVLVKGVRVE